MSQAGGRAVLHLDAFRIPMRGYEVTAYYPLRRATSRFRIPMRGYEFFVRARGQRLSMVPNPHEGL